VLRGRGPPTKWRVMAAAPTTTTTLGPFQAHVSGLTRRSKDEGRAHTQVEDEPTAEPTMTMTYRPFRVHVSGLKRSKVRHSAEVDALKQFFQNELGCNVEDVSLMVDRKTGRSRGFAFVDFEDAMSLEKAMALDPASQSAQKLADSVNGPVSVKVSKQLAAAVKVQRWWRLRSSRTARYSAAAYGVGEHRCGNEGRTHTQVDDEPTAELVIKKFFSELDSALPQGLMPLPSLQTRGKTWPRAKPDELLCMAIRRRLENPTCCHTMR